MSLGSTQPLTKMSTKNLPGRKGWPAHKADNLTVICTPTHYFFLFYMLLNARALISRCMGACSLLDSKFSGQSSVFSTQPKFNY
jgi:hypothetical protein